MARKLTCDNVNCAREVDVDRYGTLIDENEAPWISVYRRAEEVESDADGEDEVVIGELNLEFCCIKCAAERLAEEDEIDED